VPLTAAYAGTCDVARARGLAARVHPDAGSVAALGTAVLETTAAALACAGGRRALARDRTVGRLDASGSTSIGPRGPDTVTTIPVGKPDTAQRVGVLPSTINHLVNSLARIRSAGANHVDLWPKVITQVVNARGADPMASGVSGFSSGPRGPDTFVVAGAGRQQATAKRDRRAAAPFAARVFGSRSGSLAIDVILSGLDAIAPVTPDRFFALHYSKLALQSRESRHVA
jgi:hypothetical protein